MMMACFIVFHFGVCVCVFGKYLLNQWIIEEVMLLSSSSQEKSHY